MAMFAIPAVMAAYANDRPLRTPLLVLGLAGALVLLATALHPGGYALRDIPLVFFGVIGRILP